MQNVKKFLNKKVLLAAGMLVFAAAAVAGFTGAFFSDTETSNQNVFQAGTLDLEVGIESGSTIGNLSLASLTGNEALFNFQGLIPGASEGGFFKLRSNVDAWACVAPEVRRTYENGRLAPEIAAGDTTLSAGKGELQNFLQIAMWTDVNENGTYEDGTDEDLQVADITAFDGTYLSLLDSSNADYMEGNDRREVGFQYCFGTFADPTDPSAGCDGSNPDTNQAQTDSVEVNFVFVGMQYANNPSFTCESLNPEVLVTGADLATSIGDLATNPDAWLFYNDSDDTIMTPNQFAGSGGVNEMVAGAATPLKGTGSAQMTLHESGARYNIATYQFKDVALADITSLSFATYATAPTSAAPFLHFNVDFDNSDTWQRRLVYVPNDNYTVSADVWAEYDAIDGGAALWRYSGPTWPGTADPGATPKTWSDILALYPAAETRSTDSFFGVRVGHPGPDAYTGYVDFVNFNGQIFNFEN